MNKKAQTLPTLTWRLEPLPPILALTLHPVALSLALVVLAARVLDVDLGTTAARSAETSAQPARQPALDGAGPLDVHQHALTIDFLTVGVLVRGYSLPRVVRLCIFVWDRK